MPLWFFITFHDLPELHGLLIFKHPSFAVLCLRTQTFIHSFNFERDKSSGQLNVMMTQPVAEQPSSVCQGEQKMNARNNKGTGFQGKVKCLKTRTSSNVCQICDCLFASVEVHAKLLSLRSLSLVKKYRH